MSSTATSSIKLLASSTAQLLGSTQVVTSPLSAIKELVENALDARASTISIEISSNTLDVIQVRDDGHGIAPDDRSICCKKHTTSKIRDMDELKVIGGVWLGFRGEALFSLREIVGTMFVITRVEGESTAVKFDVGSDGEAGRRTTVSHATGTTVQLLDFFCSLPVRRQNAEGNATKCLRNIRKLLEAYALVRPRVRLSMRVLRTKNETSNFLYPPKKDGASVRDAAYKIVGRDCASECAWSVLQRNGYEIQALLPKPESDSAKISNKGNFVSVDSRPMSTSRGTLKKLVRRIVQRMRASHEALSSVQDPFFAINLICPTGSYDPNVEPAKDDVVFCAGDEVLKAVDEFLATFYLCYQKTEFGTIQQGITLIDGSPTAKNVESTNVDDEEMAQSSADHDLDQVSIVQAHSPNQDVLQDTRQAEVEELGHIADASQGAKEHDSGNEDSPSGRQIGIWKLSMYGYDEAEGGDDLDPDIFDVEQPQHQATALPEVSYDNRRDLNPWTIARMNAPIQPTINRESSPSAPGLIAATAQAQSLYTVSNCAVVQNHNGSMSRFSTLPSSPPRQSSALLYQRTRQRKMLTPSVRRNCLSARTRQHAVQKTHVPSQHQLNITVQRLQEGFNRPQTDGMFGLPTPAPSSSPSVENCLISGLQRRQHAAIQTQAQFTDPLINSFRPPKQSQGWLEARIAPVSIPKSGSFGPYSEELRDICEFWDAHSQGASTATQGKPHDDLVVNKTMAHKDAALLEETELQLPCSSHQETQDPKEAPNAQGLPIYLHPMHRAMEQPGKHEADRPPANIAKQDGIERLDTNGLVPVLTRRGTTGGKREKLARLPLERIPTGFETHNIKQIISVSFNTIDALLRRNVNAPAEADLDANANEMLDDLSRGIASPILKQMGERALELIRQKLLQAEKGNNEELALAFAGTLTRLEKASESEDVV